MKLYPYALLNFESPRTEDTVGFAAAAAPVGPEGAVCLCDGAHPQPHQSKGRKRSKFRLYFKQQIYLQRYLNDGI